MKTATALDAMEEKIYIQLVALNPDTWLMQYLMSPWLI